MSLEPPRIGQKTITRGEVEGEVFYYKSDMFTITYPKRGYNIPEATVSYPMSEWGTTVVPVFKKKGEFQS